MNKIVKMWLLPSSNKDVPFLKTIVFKSYIFLGPVLAMSFLTIWVLSISLHYPLIRARTATKEMIAESDSLIQRHVREFGDTPASLNELRLFAIKNDKPYSVYDAWGQRVEYLRLGKVNYLIRSFAADGVQNRPSRSPDIGAYHWGQIAEFGLRYDEHAGVMNPRPSVVLFAGADNSTSTWHAKLFVDPVTGSRRLLARSRLKDNLYMVAPHDAVEEFLWVPNQDRIVFTASQSSRYSDGVYLWDLRTDHAANLFALDADGHDLDPGSKQRRLHVALSSVSDTNPPKVSVFAVPADQVILNPRRFFHSDNLYVFSIGSAVKRHSMKGSKTSKADLYDLGFLGTVTIARGGEGSPLQKSWLKLPLGGDWEKGVLAWQDFASQNGKTQLAPYAVWGVAIFYQEAAKRVGIRSRAGQIFMSYSVELGAAMTKMIVAPGYVRGIGAWIAGQS